MKRKAIMFVSAVLLAASLCGIFVSADDRTPGKLSYGIDVIAGSIKFEKSVEAGQVLSFTEDDFNSALGTDALASITILDLPDGKIGKLTLADIDVMKNQVISAENIKKLKFVPVAECESECSFVFGSVSPAQPIAVTCNIKITVPAGFIPSSGRHDALTVSLDTMQEIPCYTYLKAGETESEHYGYRIVSYPENGTLKLLNRYNGYCRYTPVDGFTGSDSFTYAEYDASGRESEQVTVNISVVKRGSDICYCDMEDDPAWLAAMKLAEKGIMVGKTVCNVAYFDPDGSVRRDEFLAMVMNTCGISLEYDGDAVTAFADDAKIPTYLKSYVSYALDKGYINGIYSQQGNVFNASAPISVAEAAVMIYNVLGVAPSGEKAVFADKDNIPDWAEQAMATMADLEVIGLAEYNGYDKNLTRAQAAEMLVKVSELAEVKK